MGLPNLKRDSYFFLFLFLNEYYNKQAKCHKIFETEKF